MNTDCLCHHQAGEGWEERFDAQFVNEPGRFYWDKLKEFISSEIAAARKEERQFILNVLDGIEVADDQMGLPSSTRAIRHALQSRVIQ